MTTLPKAKKFRLRRSSPLSGGDQPAGPGGPSIPVPAPAAATAAPRVAPQPAPRPAPEPAATGGLPHQQDDDLFANHDDGFGDEFDGPPEENPEITPGSEAEIDAIRREGLTGRQLRMARRVAQKHGLAPVSDFDAVRLLRKRGIDPLERSTMLELVIADGKPTGRTEEPPPATTQIKLPQTVAKPQLPSTKVMGEQQRALEIRKIQMDIARRRQRKTLLLFTRLAFFVLLPTLIAGYYFYFVATPLYATKSEFLIQKADGQNSGMSGMFSSNQLGNVQDSITVQSYLQSRDAMLRLDREVGFKSHFSRPAIDPIKRLPADATNEEAYKLYQRLVTIGFDPTEGIVKMEVVAADPQVSVQFSLALIKYAEEQVDHLTQRVREDQMKGARDSFEEAEQKMQDAQAKVLELQEKLGVLDPASETASLMNQISTFEVQLKEKELALQQLLDNARPNQARVDGLRGDIQRLKDVVAKLRSQLTTSGEDSASMARIGGQLKMAEVDLSTRQALMQQSLAQLETARIEANRQVRYLSIGVNPVAPDEPTYPRKFENTLLVMLVFAGLYLMISLTASILREQVTA